MIRKNRISSLKSLLSGEGETIFFPNPEGILSAPLPEKNQRTGEFRYRSAD